MNAAEFLAWIATALSLQVAAGICVVLWRRPGRSVGLPALPDGVESPPGAAR